MYDDGYGTGKLGAELRDLDAKSAPCVAIHKIIVDIAVFAFIAAVIIRLVW